MTYMKRGLTVDVCAVHIDFIVVQQSNHIVYVGVGDGMKQYVASYLLYLSNHFFVEEKQLQSII